ncbi:single-stranded DNA-binding protein [Helicobacter cappadocius]|uniref:Single-stranded DNA-binding protein n=1 Tax=Helicobacter cappadocius TaxID=3063998 RepID=A0AA90PKG7_9HELI|nr:MULTISPECIES: single-stranded DNA-binding protein [unclassified Helicobacter]MDO7253065.1 single-stranded DNA-binding protein [Helicobacter sp. faydin-H75]MDP2538809.1 single-stranded DNA-binding protein [Helicobacter sp. faydin-H76]
MYNKVIMIGNLTRNIDLKYLPSSGMALAVMGLASNRRFKKQDGSQGEEVCFIDVKLFGRAAEVANQYLRKGSKVLIEGRLHLETWSDQNGDKKSKHIIMAESMKMLDGKSDSDSNDNATVVDNNNQVSKTQNNTQTNPVNMEITDTISITDEELPF